MCFLWYFQEHNQTSENIFRNIFWNATKHMKTFYFLENSISEKYLFSGNTFTRTKRSLRNKTESQWGKKKKKEKKEKSTVVNMVLELNLSNTLQRTRVPPNRVLCDIFYETWIF